MADQSVVSGGGGTSHDNLEPELEIVDAAAIRTADAQSRRYAHTMRRGVTTPALGTRTTPIATPPDGTLPEDRDAASVAAKRPMPRDSATAPPRFVADHRDSAPLAAPRFVADRRDSAPVAVPRTAADPRDSASIAVPRTGTDRRDSAPLAAPRFVADRKSAPIAVPRSVADRQSAPLAAPRLPPEPRDSNQFALPKLALDEQDSAGVTLPKLASEPDEPWFAAERTSAPIAVPRQASDARDSVANGVPKSTRPTGATAAATETTNRSSAPSASTALYRRRNTRPTAVQAEADEPAPPSRGSASEISLEPRGPDLGPEDLPSCLPSVMLDVSSPDGMSRLRSAVDLARDAVDTGLRSAVDIARMGVPRSPMRFVVPVAVAALVALAVWLLF